MKNIFYKIILPLVLLGAVAGGVVYYRIYSENKKLEGLAGKVENGGEYLKQLKEEKKSSGIWTRKTTTRRDLIPPLLKIFSATKTAR